MDKELSEIFEKICIIIPSYNPDEKFLAVVDSLVRTGFKKILIVNDGSRADCQIYFDKACEFSQCEVLRHYRNYGKGRALKTAFNHYLNNYLEMKGAVTVDADNQHHIDDIVNCALAILSNPDNLILGVRDFVGVENVPTMNKLGNLITSWVFRVLCGISVSDTQTGLRAASNDVINTFLDLPGEKFEYETNMLIETKRKSINLFEVKIKTVYIGKNESSHFNPFIDSIRIYALILKYLSSSIASFVIDLSIFTILMIIAGGMNLEMKIAISTVVARVISSFVNFNINHRVVFKSDISFKSTVWKYYILAVVLMAASMTGVYFLTRLTGFNSTVIKGFVDFTLFLASFQIQREWVFANKKPK